MAKTVRKPAKAKYKAPQTLYTNGSDNGCFEDEHVAYATLKQMSVCAGVDDGDILAVYQFVGFKKVSASSAAMLVDIA